MMLVELCVNNTTFIFVHSSSTTQTCSHFSFPFSFASSFACCDVSNALRLHSGCVEARRRRPKVWEGSGKVFYRLQTFSQVDECCLRCIVKSPLPHRSDENNFQCSSGICVQDDHGASTEQSEKGKVQQVSTMSKVEVGKDNYLLVGSRLRRSLGIALRCAALETFFISHNDSNNAGLSSCKNVHHRSIMRCANNGMELLKIILTHPIRTWCSVSSPCLVRVEVKSPYNVSWAPAPVSTMIYIHSRHTHYIPIASAHSEGTRAFHSSWTISRFKSMLHVINI